LAKRFGVTTRTVFTWEKNPPPGYPIPVDINGYKYYPEDEVLAYERMLIASRIRELA
jgi:DNA-binding transcriptional MerR regulator